MGMLEQIIYDYTYENRERFNPLLFERDDNDIIEELKRVINCCQRNKYYTIKVNSFEVIDKPIEVYNKLRSYEQHRIDMRKQEQDNIYDSISIRESKVKLLVVNYFISIKGKSENIEVLIAVPRYVEKYYFEIQGNLYLPMWQIVDGSTYNNASTNAKNANNTQKTIFMPIKIFRFCNKLIDIDGNEVNIVLYSSNVFNKNILAFKYILAKYGLIGTFDLTKIKVINVSNECPERRDTEYVFESNGIYISVPKMIFDADYVTQSLVYTILKTITKGVVYNDLFTIDHWISHLDSDINITNYSYERGDRLLESLEGIYDESTRRSIKLPEDQKDNIYKLLLWMMRNFSDLMMKDNQDVSLKRVRIAEYIASLYAIRLSSGIHRIASNGKRANLGTIRKSINIPPFYLLSQISKCSLVAYKNSVNEDDAISSTKFSYKGISGIGEKNGSNVSEIQRRIHYSNIGIVDTCSSSDSSPGLTGVLCPYSNLNEDGFFKEYQEPNSWEDKFGELMDEYRNINGLIEVATFRNKVLGEDNNEEIEMVKECKQVVSKIAKYVTEADQRYPNIDGMIIPAYVN